MWVTETSVHPWADADTTGQRWSGVDCPDLPIEGDPEIGWLADALEGRPRAVLWCAPRGLVAPLSYRRHAGFDSVCADFAAGGWPIRLRRSGGGVVPQGPGVLNLSLTYCPGGDPGRCADAVYAHLCAVLAQALDSLGIEAHTGAVDGSFCDGRFNLAVSTNDCERKVVGTAQYWRRAGARHAVLAHAVLLFDAAPELLTERANAFEAALRSGRYYDANAITTVVQEWQTAHCGLTPSSDLAVQLRSAIMLALAV